MDLSKVILIEAKIFKISLEGNKSVLRIVEWGRKVTKEIVVLSYSIVSWVVQTLEDCSQAVFTKHFIGTSKSGNNAFIAQRSLISMVGTWLL